MLSNRFGRLIVIAANRRNKRNTNNQYKRILPKAKVPIRITKDNKK